MVISGFPNGGAGGGSNGFAYLEIKGGTPGSYAEAKIDDLTYGVGIYSSAGIAVIPVPNAGTYTVGQAVVTVTDAGTIVEGANNKYISWANTASVGDLLDVALADGTSVQYQVAGVNSYGLNEVDFIRKDVLADGRAMNASKINVGGFAGSAMKTWLNETFWETLPEELRSAITAKTVYTITAGNNTKLTSADCKIWLPTEYEVSGTNTYSSTAENAQSINYPLFAHNADRVKGSQWWWLASPKNTDNDTTTFCCVQSDGSLANSPATSTNMVAPCFRIIRSEPNTGGGEH